MDIIDYKIAIPSYKREDTFGKKTLAYLKECNVPMEKIYLFVADEDEYNSYIKYQQMGINLIIGEHTLCNQRNFITRYFKEGDFILCMDDDIDAIYKKIDDKKYEKLLDIDSMCEQGFSSCIENGTKLWGIGAVLNSLFMSHKVSNDLKYIVGCTWGYIVDHSKELTITLEDKEDYERTLLYYDKFKSVVRLNFYAPKTNYYKEKGGMQETRTPQRVTESAYNLLERFPNYCKLNTAKKSKNTEIRLYHNPKKDLDINQTSLFS